jgi:hypothetical protein
VRKGSLAANSLIVGLLGSSGKESDTRTIRRFQERTDVSLSHSCPVKGWTRW